MKLLLTSGGLMNESIINALQSLTNKPFNEVNLAFIPTAANVEQGDKWWLMDDLEVCRKLGFKSMDIVDISALPVHVWKPRLEAADVLLFEGGNTYHLMYWVRKSGLQEILPELLQNRVWVGISAGSMITNPSLILSTSEKAFIETIGVTMGDEGLRLVNFLVDPHINSPHFPELSFEHTETLAKDIPYPVYAIDDNTAIKVIDGTVEVISEGEWKKFN